MALTQVTGPYPIFTDLDGTPLDDGYLYIGEINEDPEQNPIQVFWNSALTIPATQPIRTSNGYAYRNGTPALLYTGGEFSITIRNKREEFVLYSPVGYGFDPAAVSASVVKNDFTGDGVEVDFVLSASPSTILATNIFINGVYQEKDSYTLSGNTITFSIAPPLSSSIEVMTNETGVINSGNATAISYTLTAAGAVGQTVQTKLEQYVSVADFGADNTGVADSTAAFDAAEAYLATLSGGIMFVPPGDYRLNWVCTTDNITVQGSGGLGEFDAACLRPFSLSSPTVTIADGTNNIRYCQLINLHISGSDGTPSGVTNYANNAPSALLLSGGAVRTIISGCVFYNGKKTVSLEPSATYPVTGCRFINCIIRNDILDSNLSRAIYTVRLADPGYNTDNKFTLTKLNKPGDGYAAEVDGTIVGITFEVFQSYWDFKPSWGILVKGGSGIVCDDLQLDPGVNGAIIIEADSDGEVGRFITGVMRHGGQKFKFPSYTVDIPAEADTFAWQARLPKAHLGLQVFWGLADDPYNTDTQLVANPGIGGSLRLENADWILNDELYVRGSNANNFGAFISANSVNGGAYMEALGTNQNVRLKSSGTGAITFETAGSVRPNSDGTVSLGSSGFKWSEVWAVNGSIQTSDETAKQQISSIDDAVLRAWGNVEYYQYKFNHAVEAKGNGARWHVGVIAQRVKEAFEAEGIDPFAYGILCYDEWDDEYEDVREFYTVIEEASGQELQKSRLTGEKRLVRAAGAEYGIRYDEALTLECAYLRSKLGK